MNISYHVPLMQVMQYIHAYTYIRNIQPVHNAHYSIVLSVIIFFKPITQDKGCYCI